MKIGPSTARRKYRRTGGYEEFQVAMMKQIEDPRGDFDPEWYTD